MGRIALRTRVRAWGLCAFDAAARLPGRLRLPPSGFGRRCMADSVRSHPFLWAHAGAALCAICASLLGPRDSSEAWPAFALCAGSASLFLVSWFASAEWFGALAPARVRALRRARYRADRRVWAWWGFAAGALAALAPLLSGVPSAGFSALVPWLAVSVSAAGWAALGELRRLAAAERRKDAVDRVSSHFRAWGLLSTGICSTLAALDAAGGASVAEAVLAGPVCAALFVSPLAGWHARIFASGRRLLFAQGALVAGFVPAWAGFFGALPPTLLAAAWPFLSLGILVWVRGCASLVSRMDEAVLSSERFRGELAKAEEESLGGAQRPGREDSGRRSL